jgi:hypothetical protein
MNAEDFAWVADSPIAKSVRPIMFQTEWPEFPLATHGGSAFIVRFCGRPYGVTCKHVFGDFDPNMLVINPRQRMQKGERSAKIQKLGYAKNLGGRAVGTDLADICIIEFADDLPTNFFTGEDYVIEPGSVAASDSGHDLIALGFLKEKSRIVPPSGHFAFHGLPIRDRGTSSDPHLRRGSAHYSGIDFQAITGMSGGPVFNVNANALCGMVLRGGLRQGRCILYYIDIHHIVRLLQAVRDRTQFVIY